jgi:hypothetical protein
LLSQLMSLVWQWQLNLLLKEVLDSIVFYT